jgi:filamentous hemagglutinin family protein
MLQQPGILTKPFFYRRAFLKRLTALSLIVPVACYGAPQGGQVVGGVATISQQGNTTTITQGSNRAAINWNSFDVSRDELVQFLQPGSNSVALNRILDGNASVILGRVQANGRLFLVNPRGIIFGNGAEISTAGLVASTLDVAPQQFMQSNRVDLQAVTDSEGVIVNQGLIEASVGGSVLLLGRVIRHDGEIRAERGRVQLVAADRAIIQFDSLGGFGIEVTQAVQQNVGGGKSQIDVGGTISADGGYIVLDGRAASNLFDHAVNVSGIVEAKSLQTVNGVIELRGENEAVAVSGSLDASGVRSGGSIDIEARSVEVTGRLDASAQHGNGGAVAVIASEQAVVGGDAVVDVDSARARGGRIDIKAQKRTGVLDNATLTARGAQGGGVVHVGGDYQGSGAVTSQRTVTGADTRIDVSATDSGDGGEVVVWSDDYTHFAGNIAARGGAVGGDGGFVEVSGKKSLGFFGMVDTSAIYGEFGQLLLDPAIINIINGSGGAQSAGVADGIILAGDAPSPYTISEQALEALTSNVTLTATQQINIANLADNELLFNPNGGTVTFNIDATSGTASFTMADTNDTIRVNNGNLVIDGTGIDSNISFTLGNLTTTTAGNITLNASATCSSTPFISACDGGAVTMTSGSIRSAGSVTVQGDSTGTGVTTFIFPFFIQGNGGNVSFNLGDIAANGAVNIDAVSDATGTPAGSGSTSITVGDILVGTNSAINITTDSTQSASLENVYIGGHYLTGGGNITISSNRLNLTADALIDSSIFGSGGSVSIPAAGNRVLNGHTLALGVDNIYIGDVSGSATATDLGFSQADIDLFSGSTLTLRALGNIFIGDATITGPGSALQLVADRDNSTSGDLSIASGKTLDMNGRNFTASGRNAAINGSIVNSGTGTQQLTTTIALNMGSGASLTSGSGNISLNSGAGITMASDASIGSTSGQVALTAASNIALGSLSTGNTTTSAVSVTSTTGSISNAGATTNISASAAGSRVNLSAASGINSSLSAANLALTNSTSGAVALTNDRALQITSFTNTPATTSSVTTTGIGSDLTVAGNVSSGSNLSLISSGAVTINNGATVNSNAGTLSIDAAGNAAVTGLATTNNTASAISVISGGAITDNGNANTDITATQPNAVVTLQAASGIGAANALDLSISRLALTNTTSGAVSISNNRALQVDSLANTAATTASIATTGVGSDLTIAGNVASGSNLSLNSSGALAINDGTTVNSNAGTLSINATGNAAITGLTTTNNTASAISVTSGGAISDNGNTNIDIAATQPNAVVTLQAASGIGAANALDLSISRLALTNTTSGAANITNNRALQVNEFANAPVTAASIVTTGIGSDLTIAGNVASGSNLSLTSSGSLTVADGFTVNSNAGTLSINTAGNAAITGLTTTNNTANAVSVISGGSIIGNGDTNADIAATQASAVVTLQAASGIGASDALDLSISRLALTNTTSGAANISNNRALQVNAFTNTPVTAASITTTGIGSDVTIAGNVASGSNLSLISSGAVTVNDGTTVNSNAGTLSINATGNAAVTGLTTTNNTANAVSVVSGGSITDSGNTGIDITATQPNAVVTLQAASGIGAANALDLAISQLALTNTTSGAASITNNRALQVNSFTNAPVTAASIVTTGTGSDLTIAGNVSSGSNLSLVSSGAVTVNNGTTVNSNAGTLSINATGNAAITGLTTTNNTASAVSVTSGGAITDNGDTNVDITATQPNAVVTLQAASGIGAANVLDLSIAHLALTNTTSGAVNITNNRALQVNSLTNTPVTAASITTTGTGSDLTIAGNVASGSNLSLTSSGAVTINDGTTVNSNAGTLSIDAAGNAAITGLATTNNTANAVSVISGGAISDSGNTSADIAATQPNAVVTLQAVTGIGSGNAIETVIEGLALSNSDSGDVAVVNTGILRTSSAINTGGTVNLQSSGDIYLTGVQSTSTASNAITVSSTAGAILDNGDVTQDVTATAGGIVLSAVTGIGSGNALDTNVGVLAASNTTSGNIIVGDISALVLNDISNSGGNVDLTSVGTMMVNSGRTVSTSGSSTLTMTADTGTIVLFGDVSSASGTLVLSADQSIQQAAGSTISSGSGAITLTADVDSDDVGEILQVDGAQISSTSGALTLSAAEDITLAHIQTGNATGSAIQVTSTTGAIVDGGDTATDIVAGSSGAVVTLQAVTGIGNGDAIETAIDQLSLLNSDSGDVSVANTGTLRTSSVVNDGGAVGLQSTGDIYLTGVQSASAADDSIVVTSTGGAIFDNGDVQGDLISAGGAVLDAATGIADNNNALDTAVARIAFTNADGDVYIEDADALDLASSSTSNGWLSVWANGPLTVVAGAQVDSISGSMHLHSSFDSLAVDGNLSAASGDLLLEAMDNVTQGGGSSIVMGTGLVEVRADKLATGSGYFAQQDGASIDAGSGEILVTAGGGAALASLISGASTPAAVTVTVRNGAITDAGDTDVDIVAAAGVALSATSGIGDGNALEISTAQLAATADAGNIDVANASAATIVIDQQGTGSVRYTAAGDTSASSVSSNGGDVTLLASVGGISLGTISSGGGDVQVSAASDISLVQQITSGNGAVSLAADNDDNGSGGIAFAAAAGINAGSGTIALSASQDVVVTGVSTTSAALNAISIDTRGNVIDAGDSMRDLSALNGGVVIDAASVGDGNALESRVSLFDVTSAGRVAIANAGSTRIARLVAANAAFTNTGDMAIGGSGIDVSGDLSLDGAGSIDVNDTLISADYATIAAAGDLRLHAATIDGASSVSLMADSDQNGTGNLDFDSASALTGNGATQVQLAANRIALQSVLDIATLSVTGDDIRFDRSLTTGTLTVTGATTTGNGVQLSAVTINFDDVLLGDAASLNASGVLSISDLTLGSSGRNSVLAGAVTAATVSGTGAGLNLIATTADLGVLNIGTGDLAIIANGQAQQSTLHFDSVNAGTVAIAGAGMFDRGVQVDGDVAVQALTISSMSTVLLAGVDSQRQIDISGDTVALSGDLSAVNAVTLRGATALATDINIVSGRAGENTGGVLIAGSLNGNAHSLTVDAGNNVVCADDAVITSLSSLTVTDSIKTVLNEVEAQDLAINARQEIYLNGDITAGSMILDADSNNDAVGAIFQFKDASLVVGNLQASGSIFESETRANCDFPNCAPQVPSFSDIARDRVTAEQEADSRGTGISDAFFAGQLKVSYLDADCADEDESSTVRCRQKRSMYDFLGTFLINNQLPAQ